MESEFGTACYGFSSPRNVVLVTGGFRVEVSNPMYGSFLSLSRVGLVSVVYRLKV